MRISPRRANAWYLLLWVCAQAVACLNPRPEEDPSLVGSGTDVGEPTGSAGAAGSGGFEEQPGSSAGAGGAGLGAAGSAGEPPQEPVDDELDAGADAGPDGGPPNTNDAEAPDAGLP